MISSANALSNALTNKILRNVVRLCIETQEMHGKNTAPSYYQLRSEIEELLHGVIKELFVEYKYSPMEVERMIDNKGYWNHVHEKLAVQTGREIFEKQLYNHWEFRDENEYFGCKTFRVFVIDSQSLDKLNKDKK